MMMMKSRRLRRVAVGSAVAVVLSAVFLLYLQPNLALSLATQLWNCF